MSADDFGKWVDHIRALHPHRIIDSVLIILLCIRTAIELAQKYPVFGIIFFTLSKAKYEIMNFLIVLLVG
jgi:hypothetical protein